MATKFKLRAKLGVSNGKTLWRDVGIVMVDPSSNQCKVKLDLLPAGPWDGWLMGFSSDDEADKEWPAGGA